MLFMVFMLFMPAKSFCKTDLKLPLIATFTILLNNYNHNHNNYNNHNHNDNLAVIKIK